MRKWGVAVCRLLIGTAPVPQSSSFVHARGDKAGSPRFLGNPFANMLCSSTPADRMRPATTTHSVMPSVRLTTSLRDRSPFEAQSHSLFARCLRFAARITPITPRKTRFPLAANLGGAGLEPAGLLSKVSLGNVTSHHFDPPSPSFAWRTGRRDAVTLAAR